jgi:hypothetical protein
MYRTKNQNLAKLQAIGNQLSYGFCPIDGLYYVGTVEQLVNIGVFNYTNYYEIQVPTSEITA